MEMCVQLFSCFIIRGVRREWVHLVRRSLVGLLYQTRMLDDECSSQYNENWQGTTKYSEKTCPITALSTINSTLPDMRQNWFAVVGIRPQTAWAKARVFIFISSAYIEALVLIYRLYEGSVNPRDGLGRGHEEIICDSTDNRTPAFRELTIHFTDWLVPPILCDMLL
jgi:hypothetical protein